MRLRHPVASRGCAARRWWCSAPARGEERERRRPRDGSIARDVATRARWRPPRPAPRRRAGISSLDALDADETAYVAAFGEKMRALALEVSARAGVATAGRAAMYSQVGSAHHVTPYGITSHHMSWRAAMHSQVGRTDAHRVRTCSPDRKAATVVCAAMCVSSLTGVPQPYTLTGVCVTVVPSLTGVLQPRDLRERRLLRRRDRRRRDRGRRAWRVARRAGRGRRAHGDRQLRRDRVQRALLITRVPTRDARGDARAAMRRRAAARDCDRARRHTATRPGPRPAAATTFMRPPVAIANPLAEEEGAVRLPPWA